MRRSQLFLGALLVALSLAGCGGNGQDNGTPGDGGIARIVTTPQLEARLLLGSGASPFVDPQNLETGESVQFEIVGYTAGGDRVVLPATGWRLSVGASAFGTLAGNTGVFTAGETATAAPEVASASFGDTEYAAFFQVKPRQARVVGKVVSDEGVPVPGVTIVFFSNNGISGNITGSVKTSIDGTFRASVPANSTAYFQVSSESIPFAFYKSYNYEELNFDPRGPNCRSILAPLSTGNNEISTDITLTTRVAGASGPEADGCPVGP